MPSSQLSNQDLLATSRKMLYLGIPCLPLIWVLHIAYHYKHSKDPAHLSIATTLTKHMTYAAVGVAVWTVVFVSWWAIFASNRVQFGTFADSILVNDVKGL